MSYGEERDGWGIPVKYRKRYFKEFEIYKRYNKRPVTKDIFAELRCQEIPEDSGSSICAFDLADIDHEGYLDADTYVVACYLESFFGEKNLPSTLPKDLIPLSRRRRSSAKFLSKAIHFFIQQLSFPPTLLILIISQLWNYINPTTKPQLPFKPYGALSNELWLSIFSYLPKNSLLDACRTSKRFQDLGIPLLYRDIRLRTFGIPRGPYAFYQEIPKYQNHTMVKQYRFLTQILHRQPEYATFVRVFKWSNDLEFTDRNFLPALVDDEVPRWGLGMGEEKLGRLFAMMRNVKVVDLDVCSLYTQAPRDILLWFRSSHTILIRGGMPDSLMREILRGKNRVALQRIVLDSIHTREDTHIDEINEDRRKNRQMEFLPGEEGEGSRKWSFWYRDLRIRVSEEQTVYLVKVGNFKVGVGQDQFRGRAVTPVQEGLRREWAEFLRGAEVRGEDREGGGDVGVGEEGVCVRGRIMGSDDVVLRDAVLEVFGWRMDKEGKR